MTTGAQSVNPGVDVEAVIEAVKEQLSRAASVAPHLRMTEFELELSVVVKKSVDGGFEFKIPILGVTIGPQAKGSVSNESTTKLTLTYAAPEPKTTASADGGVPLRGLPGALATIEKSIHSAENSPPKLPLKEGEVSFVFGITKEAEAGIEVVVVEGSGKRSREDTHTVTLKFRPKDS
jgi:hypothetical protein